MTDPAAARDFLRCQLCHGITRRDIAGNPARCNFCGALVEVPASSASPIVGRRSFRSANFPWRAASSDAKQEEP